MKRFNSILFLFWFAVLGNTACTSISRGMVKKKVSVRKFEGPEEPASNEFATVWVHGTSQNALIKKIHATPAGLLSFSELPADYGIKNVGEALHKHDAKDFHKENFYAFGWSGELSFKARESAGQDLSRAIKEVRARHKSKHGVEPKLRVISHSHGCNVVLNSADQLLADEEPSYIEELVLLACPVQHATSSNITSSAFKNIYSLYSPRDILQVLDPQGFNLEGVDAGGKWFSERTFEPQENLVQAQIRWKRLSLTHVGFVRERFGKALPTILHTLKLAKDEHEDSDFIIDVMKYDYR